MESKAAYCSQCGGKLNLGEACTTCGYLPNEKHVHPLKNKLIPTIVFSIVVALAISFFGYKFIYLKAQKVNAEREFSAFVASVTGDMLEMAITSEKVISSIIEQWRIAIDNRSDFNSAIKMVMRMKSVDIDALKLASKDITEKLRLMSPPEGKEADYQQLKNIYLLFNKYANMAISPSGSLLSYTTSNNELVTEVQSAIKELEMMR